MSILWALIGNDMKKFRNWKICPVMLTVAGDECGGIYLLASCLTICGNEYIWLFLTWFLFWRKWTPWGSQNWVLHQAMVEMLICIVGLGMCDFV